MKQWFSIVSLCMVAVFMFSSVLQFHHHDADGNVVVYDVNAPFSIESHSFCKHHHCADHDSNHDDDCCTLKLSTQKSLASHHRPKRPALLLAPVHRHSQPHHRRIVCRCFNSTFHSAHNRLVIKHKAPYSRASCASLLPLIPPKYFFL